MATSKPTLESLPTELKVRIAEMCKQQDAKLYAGLLRIAMHDEHLGDGEFVDAPVDSELYAWRHLNKGFVLGIGPQYGHLVETLDGSHLGRDLSIVDYLSALPFLVNVKHFSIGSTDKLAERLCEEGEKPWVGFDSRRAVETAVGRFLQRVPEISISTLGYHDTLQLCTGSAITKLDIRLDRARNLEPLDHALRSCPALVELVLTNYFQMAPADDLLEQDGNPAILFCPPSLRHLRIQATYGQWTSLLRLASLIGLHVKRLTLKAFDAAPDVSPLPLPEGISWPNVETLTVNGDEPSLSGLISHASTTVFPSLCRLLWVAGGEDEIEAAHLSVLRQFIAGRAGSTGPIDIEYRGENPSAEPVFVIVDDKSGQTARVRYRLVPDNDWPGEGDPYISRIFYDPVVEAAASSSILHEEVSRSLRRGLEKADQAAVVGDQRQLQRMVDALQELEYLQYEQRC